MFPFRLNRAQTKQPQRSCVLNALLPRSSHYHSFLRCFSGLPVLIVAVTLAVSADKYKAEEHCWLNVETDTIWAFVGPVVFVLGVRTRLSSSRSVCQAVCGV